MKTVLVIEDNISTLSFIKKILEKADYNTLTAQNGQEGVDLAKERLPDIILCDIMLPFIDGYNVLAQLKNNPDTEFIPLVFLSALSQKTNVRQGMNLGAEDYLTKPFDRKELLAMLQAQLKKQERLAQQIDNKVKDLLRKSGRNELYQELIINSSEQDILIVDDSEINRRICENLLTKTGIPFRTAVNGHEAITQIIKKEPAIVLLDIAMPIMDGIDSIRVIRKNPAWDKILIVAMSSVSYEEEILKLVKLGANDYILKPLKWSFLAQKLNKIPSFRASLSKLRTSITEK